MTEAISRRSDPMLDLLLQTAARGGVASSSLDSSADIGHQLRQLKHLLPQIWPQIDIADQKRLYDLALGQSNAASRMSFRLWWKTLPSFRREMRELLAAHKKGGVAAAGVRVLDINQTYISLLETVITLYDGGEARVTTEQDERAALAVVPELYADGLRYLEFEPRVDRGLRLRCFVIPEIEYEHEPTHEISIRLMKAVNAVGGWVTDIDFIPVHAR